MSINAILSTRIKEPKVEVRKAKQLFEDIGFTCKEDDDFIIYTRPRTGRTNTIIFDKNKVTYTSQQEKDGVITPYNVHMTVLAAILRQIEELNWHIA